MRNLPNVSVVIVDCVNLGGAINAIQKTLEQITPAEVFLFTSIEAEIEGVTVVPIAPIQSKNEYSAWMIKELGKYPFETSHILVIQGDGYVIDGSVWTDEFLESDYLGARWPEIDGFSNGNGGFSLRSVALHQVLSEDETILPAVPEDVSIARTYRNYLELKYGFTWAPDHLCDLFSFEIGVPKQPTFGFHGYFHKPYVEPIVIRRQASLGDVIQVEPVLEYYHKKGHPVILDTLPEFYQVFAMHYHYQIGFYEKFDTSIKHRVINLDMAYEVKPKQLHLKSYFEACGIKDYVLRRPKLCYNVTPQTKLFKKYCVVHIDERETTHRNVRGVNWNIVQTHLESKGYSVIQIGKNEHVKVGLEMNTPSIAFLQMVIAGADLGIFVDSGPSHIAVALNIPSVIFFGSVDPKVIHADFTNIEPLYSECPAGTPFCWGSKVSTRGVDCSVDIKTPPCTVIETYRVLEAINKLS